MTVAMIGGVGTETGRQELNTALNRVWLPEVPWGKYYGGFDTLFAASARIVWLFFLPTGNAYSSFESSTGTAIALSTLPCSRCVPFCSVACQALDFIRRHFTQPPYCR